MRIFSFVALTLLLLSCNNTLKKEPFSSVTLKVLWKDNASFRALELMPGSVAFAGSGGKYGTFTFKDSLIRSGIQTFDTIIPEFRAVAHTDTDFFMLSVGSPALLYKTGDTGGLNLVYREEGPDVFYDAMAFWDNRNGIAVGDSQGECLSVLITRDGGYTWRKLDCSELPPALPQEGAFAASNTNIAIVGNKCWIGSSKSRIFYSEDLGRTWEVIQTPILHNTPSQGIYSLAFSDSLHGFIIGGDYTQPELSENNKAFTEDGGKSWQLLGYGTAPGYSSCVQFIPDSGGQELVAVGPTGVFYSADTGNTWKNLSNEPLHSIRFLDSNVAFGSGNGRIVQLKFK
jgi:photosystem II stability/assembly factor-like uncharacterized protein